MRGMKIVYILCFILSYCQGQIWRVEPVTPELILTSSSEIDISKGDSLLLTYQFTKDITECVNVTFSSDPSQVTTLPPDSTFCPPNDAAPNAITVWEEYLWNVTIDATDIGKVVIIPESQDENILSVSEGYVHVSVNLHDWVNVLSDVLGWIYTIAWDMSFLPQIVHNWRRHSVEGLSFDFLTLNFIGFSSYLAFNLGLYVSDDVQDEFHSRNPYGVLHVRLNDVIFPAYAVVCVTFQIIQCLFYKRAEDQRVSTTCRIISGLLVLSIIISTILVPTVDQLEWLDLLYYCSYVKLFITAIKYCPQLYLNYKNKSTSGWSIWQVILDFTGGACSLIQMFMLAGNYNDWMSVLTDPAKLGLGVLSILFNILFFMQHYCLYRNNKNISEENLVEANEESKKGEVFTIEN